MGLGIHIDAPLKKLRLRLRSLEDIEKAAREAIDDPLLASFTTAVREGEGEIGIWLHPAAEPLYFGLQQGKLTASCKTSTAGPGYHAYVVELLERMGETQKLSWRWEDDDGEIGDECGYHDGHDFSAAQTEMLGWLRSLASHVAGEDLNNVTLSLPIGFSPIRPGQICSPMGTWSQEWLREVAEADDERLGEIGPRFFPWWSQGCDADFWNRYGQSLCWTEIPWHPPMNDDELEVYDKALSAFSRSRELDADIALPDLEIAELRALRDAEPGEVKSPRKTGIGFKRSDMTWQISAGWSVQAPGYWYDDVDDGSLVLWSGSRTIRACSFTVDGQRDRDLLAASTKSQEYESEEQLVRWEAEHLFAEGVVRWTDADGEGCWQLNGCVTSGNSLCVVTLSFDDEKDRSWAEAVFRTIKRARE